MKRFRTSLAALFLVTTPAAGLGNSATTVLSLTVPIRCSVDDMGGSIQGDRLVLQVHRSCNAGHMIIVQGDADESHGDVLVSYNGNIGSLAGDEFMIFQPDGYYDQHDIVEIEASSGGAEGLERLASTLSVSVVAG